MNIISSKPSSKNNTSNIVKIRRSSNAQSTTKSSEKIPLERQWTTNSNTQEELLSSQVYDDYEEYYPKDTESCELVASLSFLDILNVGQLVFNDRIQITEFLSEGAQGKIYLGYVLNKGFYVIVKSYKIESDRDKIKSIIDAFEIVRKIDHPNILKYKWIDAVPLYDALPTDTSYNIPASDGNPFLSNYRIDICMECITGKNLKDYSEEYRMIHKCRGLPLAMVKNITEQILLGLKCLHEDEKNKIIHRDLKPANIMICEGEEDQDLQIKIIDFEACTKVKDCETLKNRTATGTEFYMSPDVILGNHYAFDADIWSLGCIVFEMVCGVKPYYNLKNAIHMATFANPLEHADDDVKDIFYDISNKNLYDFLYNCWKPDIRYRPSAAELLEHKFIKYRK